MLVYQRVSPIFQVILTPWGHQHVSPCFTLKFYQIGTEKWPPGAGSTRGSASRRARPRGGAIISAEVFGEQCDVMISRKISDISDFRMSF